MKLTCIACGNYVYFEADAESLKMVVSTSEGALVEDAIFEDGWNCNDSSIRGSLEDIVNYVLKQSDETMHIDPDTGHYINTYISCARCGSKRVTPPYSKWHPPRGWKSLEEELLENRKEFELLRKEKHHADQLPVVWES